MRRAKVRRGTGVDIPRMIGHSPSVQKLQVFIERVAPSPATVLLRGESGTGKELAAAMVHAFSEVATGPFVAINCAAIPEQLLESELFGHEKGAFTGAVATHDGVFSRADKGTLFLDEIGEMSLSTQARMLRVLETRAFTRVGGTGEIKVSVRTDRRDAPRPERDGGPRAAFGRISCYRLSVIHTELPPLRDRAEDIELLVRHFAGMLGEQIGRRIDTLAPDALAALQRYRWPGNIRELRNVVERAMVLGDGNVLEVDDLPPELLHAAPSTAGPAVTAGSIRTLAELEREAIAAALEATGGNKARAAALLGIGPHHAVSEAQRPRQLAWNTQFAERVQNAPWAIDRDASPIGAADGSNSRRFWRRSAHGSALRLGVWWGGCRVAAGGGRDDDVGAGDSAHGGVDGRGRRRRRGIHDGRRRLDLGSGGRLRVRLGFELGPRDRGRRQRGSRRV